MSVVWCVGAGVVYECGFVGVRCGGMVGAWCVRVIVGVDVGVSVVWCGAVWFGIKKCHEVCGHAREDGVMRRDVVC